MPGPNINLVKNLNQLKSTPSCAWCEDPKRKLKYQFNHEGTKKQFCSEPCLNQFRKTYSQVS